MWDIVSADIPVPVSLRPSITYRPGRTGTCSRTYDSSSSAFRVSIVSRPPSGIASREPSGSIGGGADLLEIGSQRGEGRKTIQQQGHTAEDGGEHVVEIVRDAPRETAHRFHLLCLEELALERPPLRHVAGVDHYPPHDGILQEIATEGFEDAVAAVLVAEPQLEEPTALARRDPLGEHPKRGTGIVGVHQVEQLPPDELFWDIAQKREHRGARVADRALSVEHRDDIHRLLDQRLEVFLSLAQLLLHALRSALAL